MTNEELIAEARNSFKATNASANLIHRLADALEARQPSEEGEYILRLIETIKQTGGSVEVSGVKIMPCDEFGRTAAVPDDAPSEDDREALIAVVKRNRSVVKRMSDGYPSVMFVTDETIADAILAAGFSRAAAPVPSSGVDVDKLARLLCEKNYISPDGKPTCAACRDKAHEVAEWLKGLER